MWKKKFVLFNLNKFILITIYVNDKISLHNCIYCDWNLCVYSNRHKLYLKNWLPMLEINYFLLILLLLIMRYYFNYFTT